MVSHFSFISGHAIATRDASVVPSMSLSHALCIDNKILIQMIKKLELVMISLESRRHP